MGFFPANRLIKTLAFYLHYLGLYLKSYYCYFKIRAQSQSFRDLRMWSPKHHLTFPMKKICRKQELSTYSSKTMGWQPNFKVHFTWEMQNLLLELIIAYHSVLHVEIRGVTQPSECRACIFVGIRLLSLRNSRDDVSGQQEWCPPNNTLSCPNNEDGKPYKKGHLLVLCSAMSQVAELHVAATAWAHALCLMPACLCTVYFPEQRFQTWMLGKIKSQLQTLTAHWWQGEKPTAECGWSEPWRLKGLQNWTTAQAAWAE